MGAKKTNQFKLLNAAAISGTATVTSAIQNFNNLDNLFIQIRFTGTPTGTFSVEGSADGIIFDTFVFTPALTQPSGGALAYGINMNQIPAGWFRVVYTNSSGSGTLSVIYFAKDLN